MNEEQEILDRNIKTFVHVNTQITDQRNCHDFKLLSNVNLFDQFFTPEEKAQVASEKQREVLDRRLEQLRQLRKKALANGIPTTKYDAEIQAMEAQQLQGPQIQEN